LPHGCHGTHPDLINADILAFIKGEPVGADEPKIEVRIVEPTA
jgi:hypothetical protein